MHTIVRYENLKSNERGRKSVNMEEEVRRRGDEKEKRGEGGVEIQM